MLVDTQNSVNRVAALWNARVLWLRCSHFLFNSYRGYARLLIQGSDHFLLSKEGVTQGDLLSMMLYAVAVLPLIRSLEDSCECGCKSSMLMTPHVLGSCLLCGDGLIDF